MKGSRKTRFSGELRWGLLDQAFSSLSNFGLSLTAAYALLPREFATFALTFSTYLLILGLNRALTSEIFVIRYANLSPNKWRDGIEHALCISLFIGLATAILIAFFALLFLESDARHGFLMLALFLPVLLLQDAWRFGFVANQQTSMAAAIDFIWVVILFLLIGGTVFADFGSPAAFVAIWGLGAGTSAVTAFVHQRMRLGIHGIRSWMRMHWDLAPRFVAEYLATNGSQQIVLFGVAAIAGLVAVADIRSAQIVLGPLNVLFAGTQLVAVPAASRILTESNESAFRVFLIRLGVSLALAATLWGAISYFLIVILGFDLLGRNTDGASSVIVPLSIVMIAAGIIIGAMSGLRALEDARRSLLARLLASPLIICGALIGAAVNGGLGAAWGLASAMLLTTLVWSKQCIESLRARNVDSGEDTAYPGVSH